MSNSMERETFLQGVGKYEHVRITKNVVVLGVAFMVHFTAFQGTANLQSSLNTSDSLGTYTLAAMYGSLILSNIFLPVLVIRWLGCKWTIALSFIAYMPFIAAQAYPKLFTLVPAGLFVGMGGGPLWCAKCTYLTVVAEAFAALRRGETKQDVLVMRFFGLFFIFFHMAQVWGNLISSTDVTAESTAELLYYNYTTTIAPQITTNGNVAALCGARFCPGVSASDIPNLTPPSPRKIYLLSGVFLGLMVCACTLVACGADSLRRYEMGRKGAGSGLSGCRLLAVTLRHLGQRKQLLLLPITMFIGAEEAFIAVDFTASFVACGWGISRIGYAMICFGIANTLAAIVVGGLTKWVGRLPLLLATMALHAALLLWMSLWVAVDSDYVTYCTMAALWGLADGIWLVLVNCTLWPTLLWQSGASALNMVCSVLFAAYYGILFPGSEEAAFSNFRMFEATGSVIVYSISPLLCTSTKLMMLGALMVIGMAGFLTVDWIRRNEAVAPGGGGGAVELRSVDQKPHHVTGSSDAE